MIRLSFPELETKVVEGGQKGSNETASPEPKVEVTLLSGKFFGGRWWGTVLQGKSQRVGFLEGGSKVVADTILQERSRLLLDDILGDDYSRGRHRDGSIGDNKRRRGAGEEGKG